MLLRYTKCIQKQQHMSVIPVRKKYVWAEGSGVVQGQPQVHEHCLKTNKTQTEQLQTSVTVQVLYWQFSQFIPRMTAGDRTFNSGYNFLYLCSFSNSMTVVHEGGRRRKRESLCVCIHTREERRGKRNRHKTIQRVLKGLGHNMVLGVCVIVRFPLPQRHSVMSRIQMVQCQERQGGFQTH